MKKAIELPELADKPLFESRKRVDEFISSVVQDKFIRDFFMMNLVKSNDDSGKLEWKFSVEALKVMMQRDYINKMEYEGKRFEGPSLFIYGSLSNYVKESTFSRIRELFPKAQFHRIEGAGHYLHVEHQKEFLGALIPFLKDLE